VVGQLGRPQEVVSAGNRVDGAYQHLGADLVRTNKSINRTISWLT
jgi:hypothetical protein